MNPEDRSVLRGANSGTIRVSPATRLAGRFARGPAGHAGG